jgi:hypothetical protein
MKKAGGFRKVAIAAGLAAISVTASAQVNMFDGNWHFSVSPYVWLPTINMSATIRGPLGNERDPSVSIDPGSYLSSLDMAFMITAEARKGDWSIFTDWVYNDFAKSDANVRSVGGPTGRIDTIANTSSKVSVRNNLWTTAGSYTAWRNGASHLDVLAGFRYLGMDTGLDYNFTILTNAGPLARGGNISESKDFWDFIAGVKGNINLSEDGKWFMPYYVDIGTGTNSNWTWQALVGAGYRFNWGAVTLSLRNISYNFDKDDGNMRLTGGAVGLTFPF